MQHRFLFNLAVASHDCCFQSPGTMSEGEGPCVLFAPSSHETKECVSRGGGGGAEVGPEREKGRGS